MGREQIHSKSRSIFRLCAGMMYFHFGLLKFFPDLSPAETLAEYTVGRLTGYRMDARTLLVVLATLECAIGAGLMTKLFPKVVFGLLNFHILGTFMPLFMVPEICFKYFPIAPTLEGQYIIKKPPTLRIGLDIDISAGVSGHGPWRFEGRTAVRK